MAHPSLRHCFRMLPLALLLASALPFSTLSEPSHSIQQDGMATSSLELKAAGSRNLLQYQGFVLNETPRERMDRMKREMLASQQSAQAASTAASSTSSTSALSGAAQGSSEAESEEQRHRAILQKLYRKADTSTPREGTPPRSRAEDVAFEVETPGEEPSETTASAGDSDSASSGSDSSSASGSGLGSGSSAQGAAGASADTTGGSSLAGGTGAALAAGSAEPVGATALARRELPGCTLRMYGGRAAKSGKEKYGGWTLCSEGVRKGAVVYSFGIGSDVSFDYAVLRRGAKVYGFDPTKTPEYVRQIFMRQFGIQEFPRRFKYYQVGFGTTDGTVPFYRPTSKGVGSMTAVPLSLLTDYKDVGFYAKVQSLTTCRRQLRHRWIDILKIDAEGVELEACESRPFLRALGQVTQVLFEFHDRMVAGGRRKKMRCIRELQALGFTVVHQTARAREVAFARLSQFSGQGGTSPEKTATA